jgi:hypothetical protein
MKDYPVIELVRIGLKDIPKEYDKPREEQPGIGTPVDGNPPTTGEPIGQNPPGTKLP